LHAEVFGTKEFQDWAKKNVVLLEVDFPHEKKQSDEVKKQNQQLKEKYKKEVDGFPTILFLDAKGEVLGKMGYQEGGPSKWTKDADKLVAKAKH
jgi:thioredoxin-related protein